MLKEVRVEMLRKSTPLKYAYLCFPTASDLENLRIRHPEKNSVLNKILNGEKKAENSTLSVKDDFGPRRVIGRFTQGFFTYEKKSGAGRAFVHLDHFKKLKLVTKAFLELQPNHFKLPEGAQAIALVKKVSSIYYHYCIIYDKD